MEYMLPLMKIVFSFCLQKLMYQNELQKLLNLIKWMLFPENSYT